MTCLAPYLRCLHLKLWARSVAILQKPLHGTSQSGVRASSANEEVNISTNVRILESCWQGNSVSLPFLKVTSNHWNLLFFEECNLGQERQGSIGFKTTATKMPNPCACALVCGVRLFFVVWSLTILAADRLEKMKVRTHNLQLWEHIRRDFSSRP